MRDETNKEPEITWAKTTYKTIAQKKPKVDIPEETSNLYPEIDKEDGTNYLDKITKEGKKHIAEITEESNNKIGFNPITKAMIKDELNLIRNKGLIDVNKEYNKAMIMATKNSLTRFMKENLKLDERTRNSIKIKEIYPSQSETSNTIYIKCQDTDDIAKITAAAINLPKTNHLEDPPTLVQHVPKQFYKRYQGIEKLLWQIRMTKPRIISTNIRLGRLDYLIRWKNKNDPTKWKEIAPMKIPNNSPYPEIDEKYWKNETEEEQNFEDPASGNNYKLPEIIQIEEEMEQDNQQDSPQATRGEQWTPQQREILNTKQRETNDQLTGTITNNLKNKHKMSPAQEQNTMETTKKFRTSEEINKEAEIKDLEIQKRTVETFDKILKTVNNQVDLRNIIISRTDNNTNQNEENKEQHHD